MVHSCVIFGCTNRADGDVKRSFFTIPSVIKGQGEQTEKLSEERRALWIARINRKDFNPNPKKRHLRVCSDHFISGEKATLYDRTNPDWAPSVKLGNESPSVKLTDSAVKRYDRVVSREGKKKDFCAAQSLLSLQKPRNPSAGADLTVVSDEEPPI